jgi:RHS repeat-associated protein
MAMSGAKAQTAVPTISPAPGRYLTAQSVTISDGTGGATIYYTTNGTTPTTSSTQYTGPITIGSTETVSAIAVAGAVSSDVAIGEYTIGSAPIFSPVAGTYTGARTVSITSPDFGATIYYTTNGTTPTTSSTRYAGPISVNSTETIEAIAVLGTTTSTVSTATYTINPATLASSTATITVNGGEQPGDFNTITVAFNGFRETVSYGPFSTTASIASAFGAKFSNDYLAEGLCADASGATISFKLKGSAPFGQLDVQGSTASFQLQGSGFATQVVKTADVGTVTLTVNGVVAAQTNYGDGATPSTVAEGLASGVNSASPVTVTALDSDLFLQSKQAGASTNYSYTLQTTTWDSADFSNPSFVYPTISGSLAGGAGSGPGNGQTLYSYSIPSYVSGSQPTGYDAAGNIVGYSDSVMGNWSMSGGYDPLYRLTSAGATSGIYSGLQISWGYDPFGNRTSETYSGTSNAQVPGNSTASYNTNNQVSSTSLGSVGYDAAGDVTQDNQNQYLYDGEGRVCAVKSLTFGTMTGYVYGADGTRVSTGTITAWGSCDPSLNGYQTVNDSIQGPGGQLTEAGVDGNGNVVWEHTNVWANGEMIATYDPNGLHFFLDDWAGSRRAQTDYQGVVEQTCTNLPYGEAQNCGPDPGSYVYAGLQRDSMANMDNAMFRQYASTFGRWTSPDPYGGSADVGDPQSLNRYAYAGNSPFVAADPSGLQQCIAANPITCIIAWPSPTGVDPGAVTGWLGFSEPDLGATAGGGLFSTLVNDVGSAFVFGDAIYDLGKDFGWWGGGSSFHGNVAASQTGKNVPGMGVANVPGPGGYDGPFGQEVNSPTPSTCHFPECFPYYGNYGGPGWTGGQWAPWESLGDPFSPGIPSGLALPIDSEDALYMNHDRTYSQSRLIAANSFGERMAIQSGADFRLTYDLFFNNPAPVLSSEFAHGLGAIAVFPVQGSVKGGLFLLTYCAQNPADCTPY